jgi:hypothetical protein
MLTTATLFLVENCDSFLPVAHIATHSTLATQSCAKPKTRCFLSNQQFDLSKPVFDLFTFRSIRGDALLRYSTLNQSEPLRINLYGLLALSLFAFPSVVSEAVGGEPASTLQSPCMHRGRLRAVSACFLENANDDRSNCIALKRNSTRNCLKLRLPMNALSDVPFTDPATFGALMKMASMQQLRDCCRIRNIGTAVLGPCNAANFWTALETSDNVCGAGTH